MPWRPTEPKPVHYPCVWQESTAARLRRLPLARVETRSRVFGARVTDAPNPSPSLLTPGRGKPLDRRELASFETASATQFVKDERSEFHSLGVHLKTGLRRPELERTPEDHAADALALLTREALIQQALISQCAEFNGARASRSAFRAPHDQHSCHASRIPVTSQNAPVENRRLVEAGRRDTDSYPTQLHIALLNSSKHTFQRTRRANLATLETTVPPG